MDFVTLYTVCPLLPSYRLLLVPPSYTCVGDAQRDKDMVSCSGSVGLWMGCFRLRQKQLHIASLHWFVLVVLKMLLAITWHAACYSVSMDTHKVSETISYKLGKVTKWPLLIKCKAFFAQCIWNEKNEQYRAEKGEKQSASLANLIVIAQCLRCFLGLHM